MKIPDSGETIVRDALLGRLTFPNNQQDDQVLVKANGIPTYHLAHLVDDHFMDITHVLRGNEWLGSVAKHVILHNLLEWEIPTYVHLPVILDPRGGKLSKRKTVVGSDNKQYELFTLVKEYKEAGYLPQAVNNFLALLGAGYDADREIFSTEELLKIFTLENIRPASPTLYPDKLNYLNGIYIRQTSDKQLLELILPYAKIQGLFDYPIADDTRQYLLKIIPLIKQRINLLPEANQHLSYFFGELLTYENPNILVPKKAKKEDTIKVLNLAQEEFELLEDWTCSSIEYTLEKILKEHQLKKGLLFMSIRIATTGTSQSPDLVATLEVLGKTRCVKRIQDAIDILQKT